VIQIHARGLLLVLLCSFNLNGTGDNEQDITEKINKTIRQKIADFVDYKVVGPLGLGLYAGAHATLICLHDAYGSKLSRDKDVIKFVRNELKKIGLPQWKSIIIDLHAEIGAYVTFNHLHLGQDLIALIKETGDAAGIARAVIHHEVSHYRNLDVSTRLCISPALFYITYQPMLRIMSKPEHVMLRFLISFCVSQQIYLSLCRWQESRADEAIIDDPHCLFAALIYFEVNLHRHICSLQKLKEKSSTATHLLHFAFELIDTHPSFEHRIKRLQERIAQNPLKDLLSPRALEHALDPDLIKKIANNTPIDELGLAGYAAQFIDKKNNLPE